MSEMTGTESIFLHTYLTNFIIFNNTHATVEQTTYDRFTTGVCIGGSDFTHGHSFDGCSIQNGELYPNDGFHIIFEGQFRVNSHLFYVSSFNLCDFFLNAFTRSSKQKYLRMSSDIKSLRGGRYRYVQFRILYLHSLVGFAHPIVAIYSEFIHSEYTERHELSVSPLSVQNPYERRTCVVRLYK